MVQVN